MKTNLITVSEKNLDAVIDLRYASTNNFTCCKIYKKHKCILREDAFEHLVLASELANKIGLKLKIFDAFRPISAQEKLWAILPNPEFIASPKKGSPHSRGIAVDLTLIDKKNNELDMGTDFDEFSKLSFHGSKEVSKEAFNNRLILLGIMTDAGWDFFRNEWWHYQLFNSKKYPLIEKDF